MSDYYREVVYQIWNRKTGERYEVGDDGEGLGQTELRFVSDDGVVSARLTIADEALAEVISALKAREG